MVKIKHLVINNLIVDSLREEDQVDIIRDMNQANISFEIELDDIVFRIYDIRKDDRVLREVLNLEGKEKKDFFDYLRANYWRRREFFNTKLELNKERECLKNGFRALGFDVLD